MQLSVVNWRRSRASSKLCSTAEMPHDQAPVRSCNPSLFQVTGLLFQHPYQIIVLIFPVKRASSRRVRLFGGIVVIQDELCCPHIPFRGFINHCLYDDFDLSCHNANAILENRHFPFAFVEHQIVTLLCSTPSS